MINQSRLNSPLFQSRIKEVKGQNISANHITWLKALSPKPKNIVFKYVGSPRILTRSMMKKRKEEESRIKEKEEVLNETTPVKALADYAKMNQSISTNIFESNMNEKRMKSSDNYTFSGLMSSLKK